MPERLLLGYDASVITSVKMNLYHSIEGLELDLARAFTDKVNNKQ
jgi:hypothetical protein